MDQTTIPKFLRKTKRVKTKSLAKLMVFMMAISFMTACSLPVTRVDVQSFEIRKAGIQKEQALTTLTGIFLDRGFDIKFTNKDAGVITTEYKRFASVGGKPPFDYYMQIKARVKIVRGETSIILNPVVKEQNRLNAAAYTEHELSYYTGAAKNIRLIDSMRKGVGWRVIAQTLFMNVVIDTAKAFGLSVDDVIQNVAKTPANAFSVD